mmetsp:Transcript_9555/g.21894  ORF Transcript_9555/g.21894 Transcript_9555/m.21894 type:complete len:207 (+) Transcript_9555:1588-2208(+)
MTAAGPLLLDELAPPTLNDKVRLSAMPALMACMIFCPLASEALYSRMSKFPCACATSLAAVVLPIPGGPLTNAALAFMLSGIPPPGLKGASFFFPLSTTSSQSRSHWDNFLIALALPTKSSSLRGTCRSTHKTCGSCREAGKRSRACCRSAGVAAGRTAGGAAAAVPSNVSSSGSRRSSGHFFPFPWISRYFRYLDVASTGRPSSR